MLKVNVRSRVKLHKNLLRFRLDMNKVIRSKARLVLGNKIGLDFRDLRENRRGEGRNDTKP